MIAVERIIEVTFTIANKVLIARPNPQVSDNLIFQYFLKLVTAPADIPFRAPVPVFHVVISLTPVVCRT